MPRIRAVVLLTIVGYLLAQVVPVNRAFAKPVLKELLVKH